jgi:hypothetical protein
MAKIVSNAKAQRLMIPAVGCSRQSAQHPREAGVLALDVRGNNSIPGPSAMNARLSLARRRADRAADSVIDAGLGQQNKMEWNLSELTEVLDPPTH